MEDPTTLSASLRKLKRLSEILEEVESPEETQLEHIERLTSKVFRKIAYYVEQETPINNSLYINILELFDKILDLNLPDDLEMRVFKRAEYIEEFYRTARNNQV